MTEPTPPPAQTMSVATWNMDHWRRTAQQREAAWRYLRDVVRPSVALLQETELPRDLPRGAGIYREIGRWRQWGSAVVALQAGIDLEEIWSVRTPYSPQTFPVMNTFPGSVLVARAKFPGAPPITFVSVYTMIDVYSQTTLLRIVADLIPLFDSVDGQHVILGGDLNMGTDTSKKEVVRYKAILDAVASLGLVNLCECVADRPPRPDSCHCGREHCAHLTTRTGGGQFDYLFASKELARVCRRLRVYEDPGSERSDHWPVIADFDLTAISAERRWDIESFTVETTSQDHPLEIQAPEDRSPEPVDKPLSM